MNKILKTFFPIVLVSLCISCGGNGIERKAKETMRNTAKELAKDPSAVKLTNEEILFSNDSLCVINVDITGKNSFDKEVTDNMEYIYLISNGVAYEALHKTKEFKAYLTQEEYEKDKVNKIYMWLDYPEGLYYISSTLINTDGRAVGATGFDQSIHIPSITGAGDWELGEFHDEFGDGTGKKYLLLFGWGEFSNSATTDSRLMASLQVFDGDFSFHLFEYGDIMVKGEKFCTFKIKDSNGNVHEMPMFNASSGSTMFFPREKYNYDMEQILSNGGEIVVVTEMGNYIKSSYRFKMDVSGYEKAKTFLE